MSTNRHLVFVYGTLKAGRRNHCVIASPTTGFVGEAITRERFVMFDGSFPRISTQREVRETLARPLPGTRVHTKPYTAGRVAGQLYSVSSDTLAILDDLEGVEDGLYRRDVYTVSLCRTGEEARAFVYVAKPDASFAALRALRPVSSILSW